MTSEAFAWEPLLIALNSTLGKKCDNVGVSWISPQKERAEIPTIILVFPRSRNHGKNSSASHAFGRWPWGSPGEETGRKKGSKARVIRFISNVDTGTYPWQRARVAVSHLKGKGVGVFSLSVCRPGGLQKPDKPPRQWNAGTGRGQSCLCVKW